MSSTHTSSSITPADLARIEITIKKALQSSALKHVDQSYLTLLEKIVDALNEIRLTVQFDHEERLRALEEFLQDR